MILLLSTQRTGAGRAGQLQLFLNSMAPINSNSTVTRNQRRRQRTRETILAAAERVFRRKGIDRTTVNDITEQADVAYGSFYNHFKSIDEVVSAIAAASLQRVADRTRSIVDIAAQVELLPCVGARVILRTLSQDPAIHWLIDRPHVFVDEFYKVATPFMIGFEQAAVDAGVLRPAGGHECWLRVFPWILISELTALSKSGDIAMHEERFAQVSLRLLGIDDALTPRLLARSLELVAAGGIPEPKQHASKRSERTAPALRPRKSAARPRIMKNDADTSGVEPSRPRVKR